MQRAVRWFGLEIYVYIYSWGCPCKKLGVSFYEDPLRPLSADNRGIYAGGVTDL